MSPELEEMEENEEVEEAQRTDAGEELETPQPAEGEASEVSAENPDEEGSQQEELAPEVQQRYVEALVLSSGDPLSAARIARLIPGCTAAAVRNLVRELNGQYLEQGRAFEICDVGGGFQMRTLPEFADVLRKARTARPLRLSPAAMESLSIIAYREPVTRADVEHIRGVESGAVLRGLLERRLIRITGHREVAGRPLLYGTTRRFLELFGLSGREDLPTLRDLEELLPTPVVEGAPAEDAPGEAGEEDSQVSTDPMDVLVAAEPSGEPH
ncbi:SMC-Scp complex subunit ScpB [Myxococcota bacterium]|nr:SMC-Scp complex subunit ScpB [Myxococcota bacterium]